MFAGLVLSSIAAAAMQSALFQRKSRSGWLEELDGIREDALEQHDGGVANVVDADDIWTDLRDGGEYEDPHEISSLYATDETPDLPVSKSAAKAAPRNGRAKAKEVAPPPPPATPVEALLPPPPAPLDPAAHRPREMAPPPPAPPAPVAPVEAIDAPAAAPAEVASAEPAAPAAQYDDQIWVQPAPHPIRPSEMWHPAELAPAPLAEESFELIPEERVRSADLMDPTYHPRHAEPAAPVVDPVPTTAPVAEPVAAAEPIGVEPVVPSGNLVNGPVGRRVRRDRPTERPKASLPPQDATRPVAERGEQSPLPDPVLPPAALPTRSHRLPGLELPATPSSVVQPRTASMPAAPAPAPAPVAETVVEPAPAPSPAPTPVAAAPEAPAPAPVPEPAPVVEADPEPIDIGDDGLVAAPGTIVRIGGDRQATAVGSPDGVVIDLTTGWCWASPGDGAAGPLRIDLPSGSLTVDAGATALAVAEADGSVFVVVAAGSVQLERGGDRAPVARGTIVMIDPSGAAQSDAASDAEIEADPIVAENLALDAEL